jgi:hypothetical protein
MQQDLEKITCAHFVSAIRCSLIFSDLDKPSHWFREYLRSEFPIERCQPQPIRKGTIEGFRPTQAYFDADETTFVWQDGKAVFIQSEAPHNRVQFLKHLEAVVHACAETRPLNSEPLQLVCIGTSRFEFMPYDIDQFELHRYFNIVPAPSPEIRKHGVFLFQNDINLKYANHNGDYIAVGLKFPSYGPSGTNGFVDLEIATITPCVWWLDTAKNSVTSALGTMHELTHEATTAELRRILNWN